jgi:hypothetical protein
MFKPFRMKKMLPIIFLAVFLLTCNKEDLDPCLGVTCMNGGACKNGTCDCPEHYEGPNCINQETPTKIIITKIEVTKFPSTRSTGLNWDVGDGPDIYVGIIKDKSILYTTKTYFTNSVQGTVISWSNLSIEISSPKDRYEIDIIDYDDANNDDFMDGVEFTPYGDTNGFPTSISLSAPGSQANFKITVSYQF